MSTVILTLGKVEFFKEINFRNILFIGFVKFETNIIIYYYILSYFSKLSTICNDDVNRASSIVHLIDHRCEPIKMRELLGLLYNL